MRDHHAVYLLQRVHEVGQHYSTIKRKILAGILYFLPYRVGVSAVQPGACIVKHERIVADVQRKLQTVVAWLLSMIRGLTPASLMRFIYSSKADS